MKCFDSGVSWREAIVWMMHNVRRFYHHIVFGVAQEFFPGDFPLDEF